MNNSSRFKNILICLQDLKDNKMIVVPDREDRENEADIITQGAITPEMMNWIATNAKGLICCPTTKEIAAQAGLAKMAHFPVLSDDTPFTVSIDAIGTSTGISAYDRAHTVNVLASGQATIKDFKIPGHMFPLIANDHLLKAREGHTEATVTLMKLSGLKETGVCCEIMGDDGHMITGNQIIEFSQRFGLNIVTIDEIKDYYFFSQILVDTICKDNKKLIVNDPFSNINYSMEIFNFNDTNIENVIFDVLVMNEYKDVTKNLVQTGEVSLKLSSSLKPTIVIDLMQMNPETTWYVLNSILKIANIKKINTSYLNEKLKTAFSLCDVEII